jgi:dTDP-4-dehydrorhamnose 3,5-epimerase
MRFVPTALSGAIVVEQERHADERGFFARTWCAEEFARHGLEAALTQCSVSFNHRRGTVRGLHYQAPPYAETKLVRCTRGAVYDVAVDLRPDSPTFRGWIGVELTEDDGRALYVPRGFGHGFYALSDRAEVTYQISAPYHPEAGRGVRWDDPFHGIRWPGSVEVLSRRDGEYADVRPEQLDELRGLWTPAFAERPYAESAP